MIARKVQAETMTGVYTVVGIGLGSP